MDVFSRMCSFFVLGHPWFIVVGKLKECRVQKLGQTVGPMHSSTVMSSQCFPRHALFLNGLIHLLAVSLPQQFGGGAQFKHGALLPLPGGDAAARYNLTVPSVCQRFRADYHWTSASTAPEGGLHRHYRTSARQLPQRADSTGPARQQPLRADSDR